MVLVLNSVLRVIVGYSGSLFMFGLKIVCLLGVFVFVLCRVMESELSFFSVFFMLGCCLVWMVRESLRKGMVYLESGRSVFCV